ncbi:hypothetical protein [Nocardia grenadensis]|uniref:hypothetical protein n=1 Tax=Nocardia grenadensis TaxID=931537 RepID=UPI003D70AC5C
MFGHSGGGFTTAETMLADQRISAGADLDGSMAYSQSARDFGRAADEGLDRPFLLMSAGDHSLDTDASWQQFRGYRCGPLCQVHLPDGEHFSYTDYQILLPQLGGAAAAFVGTIDPAHSGRTSQCEKCGKRETEAGCLLACGSYYRQQLGSRTTQSAASASRWTRWMTLMP